MKTRHGIFYNLHESSYVAQVGRHKYYFSSQSHLDKFNERYPFFRKEFEDKLKDRYGIRINFNLISQLLLYKKIETRGFLVESGGEYYTCLDHIKLIGVNQIQRNLQI